MRREFEFISKLDTADVNYILSKKKEQAAILIQRNFKKLKARKELRERRQGLYAKLDEEDTLNWPEDGERARQHKQQLDETVRYVETKFQDIFYSKITEDRKQELVAEVAKRRKLVADSDMKLYNVNKIRDEYNKKFE